jgi:hypothetical protein
VIRIQNDSAFVKPPLNLNVDVSTMNATAYLRHEGAPIPLTRLTLSSSALGVFTQELVRAAGPAAESPFNSEMRKAIGLTIDPEFIKA